MKCHWLALRLQLWDQAMLEGFAEDLSCYG